MAIDDITSWWHHDHLTKSTKPECESDLFPAAVRGCFNEHFLKIVCTVFYATWFLSGLFSICLFSCGGKYILTPCYIIFKILKYKLVLLISLSIYPLHMRFFPHQVFFSQHRKKTENNDWCIFIGAPSGRLRRPVPWSPWGPSPGSSAAGRWSSAWRWCPAHPSLRPSASWPRPCPPVHCLRRDEHEGHNLLFSHVSVFFTNVPPFRYLVP